MPRNPYLVCSDLHASQRSTVKNLVITDPSSVKPPTSAFDRFLARLIYDPRDIPLARAQVLLALLGYPLATLVFLHFSVWTVALFLVFYVIQLGPYTLMLHNVSHRRYFRSEVAWLDLPFITILGTLFGHTPQSYYAHHIGMHHPENNLEADLSTTIHLKRDSVFDFFFRYLGRFLIIGEHELSVYLGKNNRGRLRRNFLIGAVIYWGGFALLCFVNWQATLVVFLATMVFTRCAMMAGNWGQHAFIDPARPDNCYVNSITCINGSYNRRCFNDGYHISHHWKATRHWTEHPDELKENIERYAEADAIIFRKIDFFLVWFFLMLKRYDWLAHFYVPIDNRNRSKNEIISLLKSRTRPIPT